MKKPLGQPAGQTFLNFEEVKWPDQSFFPLNLKNFGRTVQEVVYRDISESEAFIILTGFTSLSNLIDLFGSTDHPKLKKVRILIGFEPNLKGRKQYPKFGLDKEIKEYWVKQGLSILQGGAVIHLIEKIKAGRLEFKFLNKLHAKIYVGDRYATLGSSNFSKNGLNIQDEANIRVENAGPTAAQYRSIKMIADAYFEEASSYDKKLIALLQDLISEATWEEALARAIAEMLEGKWLNDYKEIISRMQKVKLWPTQWKGLTQAVTILQSQSNVLIADPTGAGKTRLCTSLVLCLQHWLYESGKSDRTESLIICPPLVLRKWADEFRSLGKINHSQVSMGMLSKSSTENKDRTVDLLNLANILVIDEAHSYLADSNRTSLIKANQADHKILITATPISRRVEDILNLIKLLDVDNLNDADFKQYQELLKKPYLGNQPKNIALLRKFISQFTVRRTKARLNKDIEKDPGSYTNILTANCKFPEQREKTYRTQETAADKALVVKIGERANELKGLTYLTAFQLSVEEGEDAGDLQTYLDRRIRSGRALSIYMIRYALRSSHVALVEHIEGSAHAMKLFGFEGKTSGTGDKLEKIRQLIAERKLPYRQPKFKKELFPDWLIDEKTYLEACEKELSIYQEIAALAKKLSGKRELGKVQELVKAGKNHTNLLAFDATVITLYYLKSLFSTHFPGLRLLVAAGGENDKDSKKVLDSFKLGSNDQEACIALCSDKMSESVDLQKASCVFLLDSPSVLRVVEQRIGRADRMDSMHPAIDIFWADDSEEYSLKADERLIETNHAVDLIYGSNFKVPEALKGRRFSRIDGISTMIEEYKEFVDKDESWTGIEDRFQLIRDLKDGPRAIIKAKVYEQFADVSSEVKTKVSFLSGMGKWCFIALRGGNRKSPRWYFIDDQEIIHTDLADICGLLRSHLNKDAVQLPWDAATLSYYVNLFKAKERSLLPPKKNRALEVADHILRIRSKEKTNDRTLKEAIHYMQLILKGSAPEIMDYDRLADEWIAIFQPYLNTKREQNKKKRIEINLNSLKHEQRKILLTAEQLTGMAENSVIAKEVDKRIAACIIAV